MNATYLRLHWQALSILLALSVIVLSLFVIFGELKSAEAWAWLDVFGEGGTASLVFIWLGLMLASRPRGVVTGWLTIGFSSIFIACWADVLDEFYRLPDSLMWRHGLESIPMWLGMLTLTYGLYLWYTEQLAITKQLRKKEALFRNHLAFDSLTPLAGGIYLKQYLHKTNPAGFLVAIDIDNFQGINRQFGFAEGDRVLKILSELLLLVLTDRDFLVRQSADRFVAVLASANAKACEQAADDIRQLVAAFPFKTGQGAPLRIAVTCVVQQIAQQDITVQLNSLHRAIGQAKPAVNFGV